MVAMAEETNTAVCSWFSLAAALHEWDGGDDLKMRSRLGLIFRWGEVICQRVMQLTSELFVCFVLVVLLDFQFTPPS